MLLAHFLATAFMTGVIWFVQIVHYPLFARVPREAFRSYEREHVRRTGWVVGGPMLVEVGTAAALILAGDPVVADPGFLVAFGLLLVIWVATAVFSVPLHGRLCERPDAPTIHRLVTTNWIRTLAWTARICLLVPLILPFRIPPA